LDEEEKKKWKIIAEQDKLRYNTEKSLYKGPWQVPSERPRKDPSAPKRPPSAFLNYSQTRRTALIEENPHVKNTDISKLLGKEWKAVPQEVRQPHIDKEAREREAYHKKISAWRKQKLKAKETFDWKQLKPSPTSDKKIVPKVLNSTPLQVSPPLQAIEPTVSLPSISTQLLETFESNQRSQPKNLEWDGLSLAEGSMPNNDEITTSGHTSTNEGISLPSIPLERIVLGHTNNGQLSSTGCPTRASALQKPTFPEILPSLSMVLLPSPTPMFARISTRQYATNHNISTPFALNQCGEGFVEKGKLSTMRFPTPKTIPAAASPAAVPVTPTVQQPRSEYTPDYFQSLFFQGILEDGDSPSNNIARLEDFDLLFAE